MLSPNDLSPVNELKFQYRLLQQEYEYEKESYLQKTQAAGIFRKVKQGICWYPVTVNHHRYNSLNQFTVEIECRHEDIDHNFEYGRPVCFFTPDDNGKQRYFNFVGTIGYVKDNRMLVVLPSPSAFTFLQSCRDLGVQLYFDETTYKTMFAALTRVIEAKDDRLAWLRDTLLGTMKIQKRELYPVHLPWLNHTQETAVNDVLQARETSIVHGPPGTGKTTTLVEAIYETLHRESQVIVCAQSNTAVDWISEKLTDRGINVLRIGNPTRVNDKMLAFTYERRFEAHPDYTELWNIRNVIRELTGRMRQKHSSEKNTSRYKLSELRGRATEIEIKIDQQLFCESRVVACTLVGSANKILAHKKFTTLFIDEAAQALEAACWIAIGKADRVIFAGDYHQLPPTIKCMEAARKGLNRTLIEKITERKPEAVSLLKIQYRMHEDIMTFSSRYFYDGQLEAAPEIRYRSILEYDTPIVWVDTSASESVEESPSDSLSRINKTEAEILSNVLQEYIEKIGEARILEEQIDFGLISPYKAQVQYVRQVLKNKLFFKTFRKLLTINTVDSFQGQERDVIIISLVRANDNGHIGFLNDLRRMNVAITRARMKLIIIGDASTLTRHPFYAALYKYIEEKGQLTAIPTARS